MGLTMGYAAAAVLLLAPPQHQHRDDLEMHRELRIHASKLTRKQKDQWGYVKSDEKKYLRRARHPNSASPFFSARA
jgi:hypothetical protein